MNPDPQKARTRAWYANNVARAAQYHREYRAKNAERKKAYYADYYVKNADRLKEVARINGPAWAAANPEKNRAKANKRRAVKLCATPQWADHDAINSVYAECIKIEQKTGIPHHVDHIVPLQGRTVSGLHVHNNLQILPSKMNQSKGARFWPDMPVSEFSRTPAP